MCMQKMKSSVRTIGELNAAIHAVSLPPVCLSASRCLCMCVGVHLCGCVYVSVCVWVCVYVWVWVSLFVCLSDCLFHITFSCVLKLQGLSLLGWIYLYIYIHTHCLLVRNELDILYFNQSRNTRPQLIKIVSSFYIGTVLHRHVHTYMHIYTYMYMYTYRPLYIYAHIYIDRYTLANFFETIAPIRYTSSAQTLLSEK